MRKLLVVFLAAVAGLGLVGCGGSSGKSSSKSTTSTTKAAKPGSGGSSPAGLSSYLQCLGRHGVNIKKVAAAKGAGEAGKVLRKDKHYAAAAKACKP
jgi:hypothetical protein